MSVYAMSLFLHVVGAVGLGTVLGLEWASLYGLRRATAAGQVREWTRLLGASRFLGGPAALIVVITGIHLSATRWGPQGWIVVSLAGLVVIALLGAAVSGRRAGAIARTAAAEDGPVSAALGQRLHDPALALSLWIRTALFLGIVFLMTTKPSAATAFIVMAIALVLGMAAALPAWNTRRAWSER